MGTPAKGRADYYEPGDWNAYCSLCGRKRKASHMVQNWQGLRRCPEHNEPRQPQDFVRGTQDVQTVPWSQPQTDEEVQICSRTATAVQIASIASFVNASNKFAGILVYDTTNLRLMQADGAAPFSAWHQADGNGSAVVHPS